VKKKKKKKKKRKKKKKKKKGKEIFTTKFCSFAFYVQRFK